MCNRSNQLINSSVILDESIDWYCICEQHFGPVLLMSCSVLCFIVGAPTHSWFLWRILTLKVKHNLLFSTNITLLELFFSFECLIDVIVIMYPSMAGDHVSNFFIGLSWTFRPLIQTCICVEQYVAVIHPVTFVKHKDNRCRIAAAAAAWMISLGNSLRLVLLGVNYFRDTIFFLVFIIAVITTSFCCASVLYALKLKRPGDLKNCRTEKGKNVENQQKLKAFRIISHILISILVCYIPQVIIFFLNMAQFGTLVYLCEAVPLAQTVTVSTLLISPLFRMYSEGLLIPCTK